MTTDLVQRVLADPDNELAEIVRTFRACEDACWHVDRHVIGVSEPQLGSDLIPAACEAALALARTWHQLRPELQESGFAVSAPYVIIDDEWLAGAPSAPPPHVYVCLARDRESLEPLRHEDALARASSGIAVVDSLLTGREKLSRVHGAFEGGPGAWLIEVWMFKITWSDQEVHADTVDEVETVLDDVHRASRGGQAPLVTVQRVDGSSLSIGLGRDLSVLSYVGADLKPPYLVSAMSSDADGTIAFMLHGHESEFPLRNAIPTPSARFAMRIFCIRGQLSTGVRWGDV